MANEPEHGGGGERGPVTGGRAQDNGAARGPNPPAQGPLARRASKAVEATRSGLRRYPRELMASVREARDASRPRQEPERAAFEQPAPVGSVGPDLRRFLDGALSAVWIGHATVLLRIAGKNVLTDPVFSERIGMSLRGMTFGLQRLAPPSVPVDRLPPIDVVLLSHAHFDHLDKPSLKRLAQGAGHGATVVTARGTRRLIPPGFGEVLELGWHGQLRLGALSVHALQPKHWGARTALDRFRRYNAYVLDGPGDADRVLFAGDTAKTHAFDRVHKVDLSVFGIGAYEPWDHAHANPEQVWDMFNSHGGRGGVLLPMHHSTFDLGQEARHEPLERLLRAAGPEAEKVVCREPGEVWRKGDPAGCHVLGRPAPASEGAE